MSALGTISQKRESREKAMRWDNGASVSMRSMVAAFGLALSLAACGSEGGNTSNVEAGAEGPGAPVSETAATIPALQPDKDAEKLLVIMRATVSELEGLTKEPTICESSYSNAMRAVVRANREDLIDAMQEAVKRASGDEPGPEPELGRDGKPLKVLNPSDAQIREFTTLWGAFSNVEFDVRQKVNGDDTRC